jgi:hypothetical protein
MQTAVPSTVCCHTRGADCLDDGPCSDRDDRGFPRNVRRRLEKLDGGTVVRDIDTGQRFKPKKVKGGHTRIVPIFDGRVNWGTVAGYNAIRLLLECLSVDGTKYVLWDVTTQAEMTQEEWCRRNYREAHKPPFRCDVCTEIVTSTNIGCIKQGQGIGCRCNNKHHPDNLWCNRRDEVVTLGAQKGFTVLTIAADWVKQCTGAFWCPRLQCDKCGEIVTWTQISSLTTGGGAGCSCNNTKLQHWKDRRNEVVEWGNERKFTVLTSETDWKLHCTGAMWSPLIQCNTCFEQIQAKINSLQQGHSVGCKCNLGSHPDNLWCNRRNEVVQWGKERSFTVLPGEEEWLTECTGAFWHPGLHCDVCGEEVWSTTIAHLQQGGRPGCSCAHDQTDCEDHWRFRYDEFIDMLPAGSELLLTECEWRRQCSGVNFCPPLKCNAHDTVVTTTSVKSIRNGQGIGCSSCVPRLNPWSDRYEEFITMLSDGYELLLTKEEWTEQCTGNKFCPPIRCLQHDFVVSTTRIDAIYHRMSMGCPGCAPASSLNPWSDRCDEFRTLLPDDYELLLSNEEWREQCSGHKFCPPIRCVQHDFVVTTTCVGSIQQRVSMGCPGCAPGTSINPWSGRYQEFVSKVLPPRCELLMSELEWRQQCHGIQFCPPIRCMLHNLTITSTCIHNMQSGQSIGCPKCSGHKTEQKLYDWLQKEFGPSVTINHGKFRGPIYKRHTHFDLHLTFSDGLQVIVEADGPQHFYNEDQWFRWEGCERDYHKERWAIARAISVVRVLSVDVWNNRLDWQGYLRTYIEKARTAEPQVFLPDAPEYHADWSAYVQTHRRLQGGDVIMCQECSDS